jgi:hypothetical protein
MERSAARRRALVEPLILSYAAGHIALGAWQLVSPGSFFDAVGPFGTSNAHYTRDVGTFTLALGVALALSYRWPAWRPGVVGYAFLQYAFHSLNHLADIGRAHPGWVGPLDFALLLATAVLLGWTLAQVLADRGEGAP